MTVLNAERVHLLELSPEKIVKYTKARVYSGTNSLQVTVMDETPAVRDWLIKESTELRELRRGEELAFDLPMLTSQYLADDEPNRIIISAPLVAKKSMFGLLVAIHQDDGALYSAEDVKLITLLANQAAIAVENAQLYQKLEMEAITDGLTNVYNYRFLMSSLESEILRARRFKQSFSYVMLDVDNLKTYNDRLGHLSGSQALKEIAAIIRMASREIDLVCKYGGDEFGILLPQTDLLGAEKVTRRILKAVTMHRFDGKKAGLLSCSAGISTFPNDAQTARDVIDAADKALYQAKREGKNRVQTTEALIAEVIE